MRTSGTFQDVYNAAKNYALGIEDDWPINPVIRCEDGTWMLESDLEPTYSAIQITLEAFNIYFWESYKMDYVPSEEDINNIKL